MKILIVPDKFKGSLSAQAVCTALQKGLQSQYSNLHIITKPLADGGDGSLAVLDHYFTLKTIECNVSDPLQRSMTAAYKFDVQTKTAYVELSAASGLVLLKKEERNPAQTTTLGTGQLIRDAIQQGATTIYLFIGGSATNDGGIGIASALGYEFYDQENNLLAPIGASLDKITHLKRDAKSRDIFSKKIICKVICDVNNPFYGKKGAAYVYAHQKGANPALIRTLDNGLQNLADVLVKNGYANISQVAGAGAAGGVGGGMLAFFGAELQSGIQLFTELTGLEKAIQNCDLVITGEGKLDAQTASGKVVSGVCQLAQQYQKPVIAVCGAADLGATQYLNLQRVYTVLEYATSMQDAMENAAEKVETIGAKIAADLAKN